MSIVLASKSQRRQDLLKQFGYHFDICTIEVPEKTTGIPVNIAQENALAKARIISEDHPGKLVIGADTIVVYDNKILGKPVHQEEARQMLKALSGKQHQVITGVALCTSAREPVCFAEVTQVKFRELADYEITSYINSGEPFDKAGSYGIQGIGGAFVESIVGCYYNVVGLPMPRLILELRAFGFDIFAQGSN